MALSFLLPGWLTPEASPEQLLNQYRDSGRSRYLQQLIGLFGDDLYYYLLRQTDSALAEDISQLCWLKVIEQHRQFNGQSSFKTWLFSIARHALLDELRRQRRWQFDALQDELVADVTDITEREQQRYQAQQFNAQLALLPFLQREALVLQLQGFSLQDIGQITAQSTETIKSRLRYARQTLQAFMGEQHDQP